MLQTLQGSGALLRCFPNSQSISRVAPPTQEMAEVAFQYHLEQPPARGRQPQREAEAQRSPLPTPDPNCAKACVVPNQ